MVYDVARGVMLLTGGSDAASARAIPGTWLLGSSPQVAATGALALCPSQSLALSAAATGSGALSYQWRTGVPATNIPGATGATLSAPWNAAAGVYDCVVTSIFGTATSTPVTVTLNRADYNCDASTNPDDIGDFISDYFTVPAVAGPGGYAIACPDNAVPYSAGYKAGYNSDLQGQCGEPNPDNLGDWITDYFLAL